MPILKYKLKSILVVFGLVALVILASTGTVHAVDVPGCDTGTPTSRESCAAQYIKSEVAKRCKSGSPAAVDSCTQRTEDSILKGDFDYDGEPDDSARGVGSINLQGDCNDPNLTKDNCGIVSYLVLFTRVLSGLVGIVVILMVIVGGIQYSTARGDPQAIAAARGRIINAITALLFYLFIFAILQWLVPGGVF